MTKVGIELLGQLKKTISKIKIRIISMRKVEEKWEVAGEDKQFIIFAKLAANW